MHHVGAQNTSGNDVIIVKSVKVCYRQGHLAKPALVAEWVKPLAAVHAGQGSLPVRVEA